MSDSKAAEDLFGPRQGDWRCDYCGWKNKNMPDNPNDRRWPVCPKCKAACVRQLRKGETPMTNALHDDSLMPFGKHKGERLGEVPDDYFRWFLTQDWANDYPDLVDYAIICEED